MSLTISRLSGLGRLLALLLILYVSLDFANPMMPGAVSFDPDDTVAAIRLDPSRVDADVLPAMPGPAPERVEPPRLPRLGLRPGAPQPPAHRAAAPPRLAPRSSPDPASTGEDH